MESFEFKEVIGSENAGNASGDCLHGQFFNDQEIDAVAVFPKDIFREELKHVRVITEVDLYGAGGGLMPVDTASARRSI